MDCFLSGMVRHGVKYITERDKCLIPPVIPRLVPAHRQNSDVQRVQCVERSQWPARALRSHLPHSRMARSHDLRTVWKPEGRTEFGEKADRVGNIVLLILRQGTPPAQRDIAIPDERTVPRRIASK